MITAFIDESGNTGSRVNDMAQPIYTTAVLWIPDGALSSLEASATRIRTEFRLRVREFKGRQLLRDPRRHDALIALLEALAPPIKIGISVQHKAFMIAAMMIEQYLDPNYNSACPSWLDTLSSNPADQARARPFKQAVASRLLMALPWTLLEDWWDRCHEDSFADFRVVHSSLVQTLDLIPWAQELSLAPLFDSAALQSVWSPRSAQRVRGEGYSPNLTDFQGLLSRLEATATVLGASAIHIVHDEQRQYRDAYEEAFRLAGRIALIPNSCPLRRVRSLRFERSTDSLPLQIADCVAAVACAALEEDLLRSEACQDAAPTALDLCISMRRALSSIMCPHLVLPSADPWSWPWLVGPPEWRTRSMCVLNGQI
jgi:hypothetical protein